MSQEALRILKSRDLQQATLYANTIRADSLGNLRTQRDQLHQILGDFNPTQFSVVAIGSGARLELGHDSSQDWIVLVNQAELGVKIVEKIRTVHEFDDQPHDIEIKQFGQKLSHYRGNPRHPYPSRLVDARLIFGSQKMLNLAKIVIQDEYAQSGKLRQIIKREERIARQITVSGEFSGKNFSRRHFANLADSDLMRLFYHPEIYNFGIREGPLRLMQNIVIREILAKPNAVVLDSGKMDCRISTFFVEESEKNADATDAYYQVLFLYHLLQRQRAEEIAHQPERTHLPTTLDVKKDHLHAILETITKFASVQSSVGASMARAIQSPQEPNAFI